MISEDIKALLIEVLREFWPLIVIIVAYLPITWSVFAKDKSVPFRVLRQFGIKTETGQFLFVATFFVVGVMTAAIAQPLIKHKAKPQAKEIHYVTTTRTTGSSSHRSKTTTADATATLRPTRDN